MATLAIIIDHAPDYLNGDHDDLSLLSLPLGTGTVLSGFLNRVHEIGVDQIIVTPTWEASRAYRSRIAELGNGQVETRFLEEVQELVEEYEPGDTILTFEGRYWLEDLTPVTQAVDACRRDYSATYVLSSIDETVAADERILFDRSGRITRIRRLQDRIAGSWKFRKAIAFAAVPQQLAEASPIYPIHESRLHALAEGTSDHNFVAKCRSFDLLHVREVVALNGRVVARDAGKAVLPAGYEGAGRGVLLGKGSRIASSARVIGPVILQADANVGPNAVVIGPCVLGRRARVAPEAFVVKSILPEDCTVRAGYNALRSIGTRNGTQRLQGIRDRLPLGDGIREEEAEGGRNHARQGNPFRGRRPAGNYVLLKRALDIVGALIGIVLLLPFLPIIALWLKMESSGPVFFSHRREGLGGREFRCWKLRTMRSDAHKMQRALYTENQLDGPQFRLDNDPRVTRLGRYLRILNIDELPQLVNVLLGHMSFVGPRPSPLRENQICLPWREARLSVRPGITGLWQICRRDRHKSDFNQWIYYDIKYVRNLSFRLDLKIFFYTIVSLGGWRSVDLGRLLPTK